MGIVLFRQADGGIDALPAAFAVVEIHRQVFVGHGRPLSDDWNWWPAPSSKHELCWLALTYVNEAATWSSSFAQDVGRTAVLTFEDCLGLCELSEEEIRAIAEHEHVPDIVALEMGSYLLRGPDGDLLVSHMLIDDIRAAEQRGDATRAAHLKQALRHFIHEHLARPDRSEDR